MFQLHERLEADTIEVGDLDVCKVLLLKNANYLWVVLVPRVADAVEIIDLDEETRQLLMAEISDVSSVLRNNFPTDKINVGALGNMVPQLHIHVMSRRKDDPAWPGPVWGHPDVKEYSEEEAAKVLGLLRAELF